MTTLRVERRDRFTAVSRKTINDSRLSFKARGLLVWLLDKPDDWRCNSKQIASESKDGRDAIRSAMKELEVAGYLTRERVRADGGRWITETVIRERPEAGLSGVGNPDVGEPGANTKTETEDCYPQTPNRKVICMGCAAAPGAPCRIVEAELGDGDACPWREAS